MGDVLTMEGAQLMRCREVLNEIGQRDDVEHVVIVVERSDGLREVYYDRQSGEKVAFAASVLSAVAADLAKNSLTD